HAASAGLSGREAVRGGPGCPATFPGSAWRTAGRRYLPLLPCQESFMTNKSLHLSRIGVGLLGLAVVLGLLASAEHTQAANQAPTNVQQPPKGKGQQPPGGKKPKDAALDNLLKLGLQTFSDVATGIQIGSTNTNFPPIQVPGFPPLPGGV